MQWNLNFAEGDSVYTELREKHNGSKTLAIS